MKLIKSSKCREEEEDDEDDGCNTLRMSMGAAAAATTTTCDDTGAIDPGMSHMTYLLAASARRHKQRQRQHKATHTREAEVLSSETVENDTSRRLCLMAAGCLAGATMHCAASERRNLRASL